MAVEDDKVREQGGEGGESREGRRLREWGATLGLVVLVLVVFHQVVGLGLIFGWDDELYLLRRPEVTAWPEASWWQRLVTPQLGYPVPLPTFLHWAVQQLPSGFGVAGAHLLSLGFHAANTVLAYRLGRWWLRGRAAAVGAAAVWAVHPLCVESVAWLTDLKVVTVAFFVLGALLVWERQLAGSGGPGELESWKNGNGSGKAGELESGKAGELERQRQRQRESGRAGERERQGQRGSR